MTVLKLVAAQELVLFIIMLIIKLLHARMALRIQSIHCLRILNITVVAAGCRSVAIIVVSDGDTRRY